MPVSGNGWVVRPWRHTLPLDDTGFVTVGRLMHTAMKKPSILLIDDDDSLRRVMEFSLAESGYRVQTAASGEEGLRLFEKDSFDAVITDITMPGMNGMEVLAKVRHQDARLPVVIITAYGTIESAVEAMKQGAFDYITKPFNRDELRLTLDRALTRRRWEEENVGLGAEVKGRYCFDSIVGSSEKIREVLEMAGRVAASDATVLITGESGTGKELLPKGVHYNSLRAEGPFVAVNCAAIPENLIESELFGHVKGSFTGAVKDKEGKFELADGGTLFLDEIGDLRIDLQAKILRVLQERHVDRVGGAAPVPLGVRVIAGAENAIERASVLRRGDTITPAELPDKLRKEKTGVENIILNLPDEGISLEDLEKKLIIKALERHKGNQAHAAEYLDITRPTLIYRMEKYGIK